MSEVPRKQPDGELDTPQFGEPGRSGTVLGTLATLGHWPDTSLDAIDGEGFTIRAASCRGRSHRYGNTARQDAYSIQLADQLIVAAVADGVSNANQSEVAAHIAADTATKLFSNLIAGGRALDDLPWNDVALEVAAAINETAREVQDPTHTGDLMATTLVVVGLQLGIDETASGVVGWIGDSSAWILTDNGHWECLTVIKNQGNDIASSSVHALPIHTTFSVSPFTAGTGSTIVLMSDGIGDPLGDGTGEVGAALATCWKNPPGLHAFGAQVDFRRRSFDDDRTAIAIWR